MSSNDAKRAYYSLYETGDPEERLEDACLWKAFHDTYGERIALLPKGSEAPDNAIVFGRARRFRGKLDEMYDGYMDYVSDPGFQAGVSRKVTYADMTEAEKIVKQIHNAGKDAFIKAREAKLMTATIPRGREIFEVIGSMVYSLIDRPDSLIVQEHVKMTNERRFVVIDGQVVTSSPVAIHLTPLDRHRLTAITGAPIEDIHFNIPSSREPVVNPDLSRKMEEFAEMVIDRSDMDTMIIDVASLEDGRIEVIEFNPCAPGKFGLYACDPYSIAQACEPWLENVVAGPRSEVDDYAEMFEDDDTDIDPVTFDEM